MSNTEYWLTKIAGNRIRDADTDARLLQAGWISFRVWEHDDLDAAADQLFDLLRERKRQDPGS